MIRFVGFLVLAFAAAFGGVWAGVSFFSAAQESGNAAAQVAAVDVTDVKPPVPHEKMTWQGSQLTDAERTLQLNRTRYEVLDAANSYAATPCDRKARLDLIAALTAYTRAWQDRLDCPGPLDMRTFCGAQIRKANAEFSTPFDHRITAALRAALSQRGVMLSDFPSAVRGDVLQFAGADFHFDQSPVCLPTTLNASAETTSRAR